MAENFFSFVDWIPASVWTAQLFSFIWGMCMWILVAPKGSLLAMTDTVSDYQTMTMVCIWKLIIVAKKGSQIYSLFHKMRWILIVWENQI